MAQISVEALDSLGISLVSPASEQFDVHVQALLQPRAAASVLALKPFLVFVSNGSSRTVIAYSVSFNTVDTNCWEANKWVQFKFPDAISGGGYGRSPFRRGRELLPGERRLVAPEFEVVPPADDEWIGDYANNQRDRLSNLSTMRIVLDAVIFEDGACAGPNVSRLDTDFMVLLDAKQKIYRQVADQIVSGVSVDAVFDSLVRQNHKPHELDDMRDLYDSVALGDAMRWRKQYGDDAISRVFAEALRREPFIITKVTQ